ncbi:hypothetical protein C8R44DRAFT_879122 [Mycena epipterygia]|nr:hypothetical protein C8R44DRAFT_879122 [Mycena epipterygia]
MAFMKPPYVYNVRQGDREGFVKAIKDALANAIESYIPVSSVEWRLAEIMDHDWERSQAEWCNEPCGCLTPCDMGT